MISASTFFRTNPGNCIAAFPLSPPLTQAVLHEQGIITPQLDNQCPKIFHKENWANMQESYSMSWVKCCFATSAAYLHLLPCFFQGLFFDDSYGFYPGQVLIGPSKVFSNVQWLSGVKPVLSTKSKFRVVVEEV